MIKQGTLIQDIYKNDPWKMLICCIFLNQTTREQVDKIVDNFFKKYPDAESVSQAKFDDLSQTIKTLGLQNKRTNTVIKFSKQWLQKKWNSVLELYGIGKYAYDSWQIFQERNLDIEPDDKELKKYLLIKING